MYNGKMKMQLIHKTINVEADIIDSIKKIDPNFNLSERIRDYLRNYKSFITANSLGFDVELLQKKKDKAEKTIAEASAELDHINTQIHTIVEQREEKEKKMLEKQKENADKLITCAICGTPKTDEKLHKFSLGMVCRSCFLSADDGTIRKLMGKNDEN